MKYLTLLSSVLMTTAILSTSASAQSGFGTVYGSEACNNDPDFLTENDIVCTAIFSSTKVWDFLNGLPRRITLDELIELNPALTIEDIETVIDGITFVRVR